MKDWYFLLAFIIVFSLANFIEPTLENIYRAIICLGCFCFAFLFFISKKIDKIEQNITKLKE